MRQLGFFTVSLPTELELLPEHSLREIQAAYHNNWCQLTSLILQVRRCQKLADYFSLQEELGLHILQIDREVDAANIARSKSRKGLNKIGNYGDSEKRRFLLGKQYESRLKRLQYLLFGRQYRTIGDAMAWQLYHYQAHTIYSFGMNQSPGIISQSKEKGASEEEAKVHNYWEQESAFALRHDYTNCLRSEKIDANQ